MEAKTVVKKSSLNKLKRKNRKDVLEILRSEGPLSIAEISGRIALSKVTVTKSIDFYVNEGVVSTIGKGESTEDGGKRPNIFAFNPDYRTIFSVRIDESQILTALTNLNGEIIASHTVLYSPETQLDDLFISIQEAFYLLLKRQRKDISSCIGAVVGWLGVTDPETGVCFTSPHYANWGTDIPVRDKLKKLLPQGMPVHIDNWIRYHAYGEVKAMNPRVDKFFLISTEYEGVNGGLVIDGKIYRGAGSLSGEIGHMIVDTSDRAEVCLCGGKGCLEASVSPRRILARLKESSQGEAAGPDVKFSQLLRSADGGDRRAAGIIEKCAGFFAVGINNIMQICDPELIIIQGEFSAGGDFFKKVLLEKIQGMSLLGMKKTIRIEYSSLGTEGAILGAGLYVADRYFENTGWS